jgi:hypothetical protein
MLQEMESYLLDLHRTYPDYFVKPTLFGVADNRSMFVSFEGQVSSKTAKFYVSIKYEYECGGKGVVHQCGGQLRLRRRATAEADAPRGSPSSWAALCLPAH